VHVPNGLEMSASQPAARASPPGEEYDAAPARERIGLDATGCVEAIEAMPRDVHQNREGSKSERSFDCTSSVTFAFYAVPEARNSRRIERTRVFVVFHDEYKGAVSRWAGRSRAVLGSLERRRQMDRAA
jgi:hypothetical protein